MTSIRIWWAAVLEKIKGWKTLIWNAFIVGVAPLLLYASAQAESLDLKDYLTPGYVFFLTIAIKAVDTWLRFITTGPVGSKGEDAPTPDTKAGD